MNTQVIKRANEYPPNAVKAVYPQKHRREI